MDITFNNKMEEMITIAISKELADNIKSKRLTERESYNEILLRLLK